MGKAADWLREERRKTLGHWAAVCLRCGHAQRYFEENERALPATCPACGGEMRNRCSSCGSPFSSVFAVACEACGKELRPATQLGIQIRKTSSREGSPRTRTG